MKKDLLRELPKVDQLLDEYIVKILLENTRRVLVVKALRNTIDKYRKQILNDEITEISKDKILKDAVLLAKKYEEGNLRKVINCTGTVIHTNLGRSILCDNAVEAVFKVAKNYNNLEFDLEDGKRGSRYTHVEKIITEITGAEAALVVNNNAAAVMLVLDTLCKGREAIVSRGELVEIGGSFRIPDVMRYSGVKLAEVGTTNRTHDFDYINAINSETGLLLKVHTSNYRIVGFTESVSLEELVKIGKDNDIPVVEDIGSGVLIDFSKYGFSYEPTIQASINAGVDVVSFSGDKMLGGPQAGIIIGKKKYIEAMKKNQLTRALRIDKMTLAALEATLSFYLDENDAIESIPTLNMLLMDKGILKERCMILKDKLECNLNSYSISIAEDYSMVGGGSMPTEKIETYVLKLSSSNISSEKLEKHLREYNTPIITRIFENNIIIDVRTVKESDFEIILEGLKFTENN